MTIPTWPSPAAFDVQAPAAAIGRASILVWDAPVRVMHWLMVLCFAGAWLSAESERWRLVHISLGYTLAGLVVARLLWGLVGTRHARFASFVRGPAAARNYVRRLLAGRAPHHAGHNPAGAWAILALLALAAATTALGWAAEVDLAGEWLQEAHEWAASAMLALVGVHLLGVIVGSLAHRENLVRAMVTGRKTGPAREAIGHSRRGVAALVLIFVASFWAWQWHSAPAADARAPAHSGADGDDD